MLRKSFALLTLFFVFCSFVLTGTTAHANYPNKPIKILTGVKAGSGIDLIARQAASLLEKELGVSVLVINKAGPNVAIRDLTKERADGYTLALVNATVFGVDLFFSNPTHKHGDLIPISSILLPSGGIYANGDSPWNNFHDVVKTAKEENRPIAIAVSDTGFRLSMEDLARSTGIELLMVPMPTGSVLPAILGKHIELGILGSAQSDSILAGKTKLMGGLFSRFKEIPDQPTLQEQGFEFFITEPRS